MVFVRWPLGPEWNGVMWDDLGMSQFKASESNAMVFNPMKVRERDIRRAPFLRGFEVFFCKIVHFKTETTHDVYIIICE